LFSGSKCATALPAALVELRNFDVPVGSHSELQRIAGEELAVDLAIEPQELAFDCWEAMSVGRPEPGMTRITVTSVPKKLATQLGDDLLAAGLACQVLDALPCAMARAVELAALELLGDSVIAIDLSYTLPTVVLVKNGRPLFTRTLRGVGLQSIMQPLETGLNISTEECEQLLVRYGIMAGSQAPTVASRRTTEIIAHPIQDLVNEIFRTVDYIGQQFRSCKARQLCLFGGGALVKNLPEYISERLEMPAAPWSLSRGEAAVDDALFGVAAGLSALAWEDAACS
jgi:Tfp pilus assembly PilM family ATPase